jgi:hypothetical protein
VGDRVGERFQITVAGREFFLELFAIRNIDTGGDDKYYVTGFIRKS